MKKTIIALMLLIPGGLLVAQNGRHRAPEKVQQTFQNEYPDAKRTNWSMSNGQWHADFKDRDHGEMVAHYNRNGEHIDSHIPFDRQDVPAPVIEKVKSRYHDGRDFRYTKIERRGENNLYQVRVHHHGRERIIYLDDHGEERKYTDRHY